MLASALVFLAAQTLATNDVARSNLDLRKESEFSISAGTSGLLYMSPFSGATSLGIEAAANGRLAQIWMWSAGARLGLAPVLPEAFGRFLFAPPIGVWEPAAGFEIGVTARAHFEDGAERFGDIREASRRAVPIYLATQTMPLRFRLGDRVRLSFVELQVGTHIAPYNRLLRLQVGLFSVAMTL